MNLTSVDLSSPWAYGTVTALALVDGIVPLVPARTAVIGLGVVAGAGDGRAYPLLLLATVAAFVSDNVSYWIGAHFWRRISGALFAGRRASRAWGWVEVQLDRHGPALVALSRVLPGGPTPITLTAGYVRMPIRKFRQAAAVSAGLWSAYAFGMGMTGDALVGGNLLVSFVVALAVAGSVNLVFRTAIAVRRRRHLRDREITGGPVASGSPGSTAPRSREGMDEIEAQDDQDDRHTRESQAQRKGEKGRYKGGNDPDCLERCLQPTDRLGTGDLGNSLLDRSVEGGLGDTAGHPGEKGHGERSQPMMGVVKLGDDARRRSDDEAARRD